MSSPCIGICTFNSERGWCTGCGRTLEDIEDWYGMSEEEQEIATMQACDRIDNKSNEPRKPYK